MAYVFSRADQSAVNKDGLTSIPWDAVRNQPLDSSGPAYRQWVLDGSPAPGPYVAPPPSAEDLRTQSYLADVDYQDLLTRIKAATPTQIKTYVQNNVTDLPSAKLLMAKILLLISLVARNS